MNFRLHIGELWNLYWSFKEIIFFNYTEGSMSSIKHYNVQKNYKIARRAFRSAGLATPESFPNSGSFKK